MKMRKIPLTMLVLSVSLLMAGCNEAGKDAIAEPSTEVSQTKMTNEETEEANTQEAGPDLSVILTELSVEAGTAKLEPKDFLTEEALLGENGQDMLGLLTVQKELTPEELMVAGASYEVPIIYDGVEVTVNVAVVDTTPPVLTADNITITVGESVSYKKNASITDNSSNEVTLDVDYSAVDSANPGVYPVYYVATDSAGNKAQTRIDFTVEAAPLVGEELVNALADEVIAKVTTPEMSQYDKAYALWEWVRGHIAYSYASGDRSSVYTGAYEGLHNGTGDCYAYYATYAVLLTRAGIENICVARVGGETNHWWNLVNVGNGWYHCDTSPRSKKHPYLCFMQTDAQVQAYTESYPDHPNYYTFDTTLYPERATEIIYGN